MMRGRTIGKWAAGGVVFLLAAGTAVALTGEGTGGGSRDSKARSAVAERTANAITGDAGPGAGERVATDPAEAPPAGTAPATPSDLGGTPLPGVPSKVVKQGELQLSVKRDGLDHAYDAALRAATNLGGYLAGTDRGTGRAVLTIKVPADRFEALIAELNGLGTVKNTQVRGEDVTAEYVDLEARLRNWRAQEAVFLNLMAKATTIPDTITVQQQLSSVQQQIEQLEGRRRLLEGQAALSTLTVSIVERGAAPVATKPAGESTLAKAWSRALAASASVVGGMLLVLGVLVPIAVVAVLLALLARLIVHRDRRRPEPA